MCGDWHQADDLVQTTLIKLYVAWKRLRSDEQPDAYTRRILTRCFLDERRRPWRREAPFEVLDDRPAFRASDRRRRSTFAPPSPGYRRRQRATVVLRFWVGRVRY